jgi:hypothetical protein
MHFGRFVSRETQIQSSNMDPHKPGHLQNQANGTRARIPLEGGITKQGDKDGDSSEKRCWDNPIPGGHDQRGEQHLSQFCHYQAGSANSFSGPGAAPLLGGGNKLR